MFVLDTCVVSELMRPEPDATVAAWIGSQPLPILYTTSITEAEILFGILILPDGKRRNGLELAAREMFEEDFRDRVLSFDREAARAYARIAGKRRRLGRPVSPLDAQIAAIASARGAVVATANVADFAEAEVDVVNPWKRKTRSR